MATKHHRFSKVLGGLLCAIGVFGVFVRASSDDGALAITGAILLAAGMLSEAMTGQSTK